MNTNSIIVNISIFFFILIIIYNYFNKFKCYECFKCNIKKKNNESQCFDITQKENKKIISDIKKEGDSLQSKIDKLSNTFNQYKKDIKKNDKDADRVAGLTD
jgi:peptidoglycan hydrolase CwlO-like protein